MGAKTTDTNEETTEEQRVIAHRCRLLCEAGFPSREAWLLAESDAEWREAARFFEQGATPAQTVRILT